MRGFICGMMVGISGVTGSILVAQVELLPEALKAGKLQLPILPDAKELASKDLSSAIGATVVPAPVVEQPASKDLAPATGGAVVPPPVTEQPAVKDEMMSIDTTDLEQPEGNWLNKRIWWERAKDKYRECRDVFEAIFASRMAFLEKRSGVEKNIFNPFYREIGLEQADLREVLTSIIDYIEQEREEVGSLNEKERAFLDNVTASKKDLEQLKLDIDAINSIDDAIDKAVNTLSNKINEAHKFEQSAWEEFDAIAHELSDKRARERFYVIDGIHNNLKELQKYIAGEFSTFFNGLVQNAQGKAERAKKEVKELKDKDIDLKEQAKKLVTDEQIQEDEEAKKAALNAAQEAKKAAEAAKAGFFGNIWKWFVGILKSLWNLLFGWWLYKI